MTGNAAYVQVVCWPHTVIVEEYNVFRTAQQLLAQVLPSHILSITRRLSDAMRHARVAQHTQNSGSDDDERCGAEADVDEAAATCMAPLPLTASLLQRYLQQRETENRESGGPHTDSDEDNSKNANARAGEDPSLTLVQCGDDGAARSSAPPPLPSSPHGGWLTVQPALEYVSATYGPLHAVTWPQWEELQALHGAEVAPVTADAVAASSGVLVEVVLLWCHEGTVYRVTPEELRVVETKGSVEASSTAAPTSSASFLTCNVELEYPPGILLSRKLPLPLAEPLLTRRELIELVRRTANIRQHQSLRVAYRVWPRLLGGVPELGIPLGMESVSTNYNGSGSAGGGAYTPTTGGPPLRAIESDSAVAAFVQDTLTHGSAAVRVVAVQSARAAPPSPLPTTAPEKRQELQQRVVGGGRRADAAAAPASKGKMAGALKIACEARGAALPSSSTAAATKTEATPAPASTGVSDRSAVRTTQTMSSAMPAAAHQPRPAAPPSYTVMPLPIQKGDSNSEEDGEGEGEDGASHNPPPSVTKGSADGDNDAPLLASNRATNRVPEAVRSTARHDAATTTAAAALMPVTTANTAANSTPSPSEACSRHSHTRGPVLSSEGDDLVHADDPQRLSGQTGTEVCEEVHEREGGKDNVPQRQRQEQLLYAAAVLNVGVTEHAFTEVNEEGEASSNDKPPTGSQDRTAVAEEDLRRRPNVRQNIVNEGDNDTACAKEGRKAVEGSANAPAAVAFIVPTPPQQQPKAAAHTSSVGRSSLLDPHSMVFVRYEVEPTAVYVSGPVSQAALQQLQDVIFRRCCAPLSSDADAPRPRFHVHGADDAHVSNVSGAQNAAALDGRGTEMNYTNKKNNSNNNSDSTSSGTLSHAEYVLPLYAYTFTQAEENTLERCVAEVMAVYQGLEQLPAKEAAEWAQAASFSVAATPALGGREATLLCARSEDT
ncbi:hypothetical protein ABB37_06337 [Leptomonas pyrrhocoris]|uniref:Uncharacterized protein n=1 Tax=Leptomonas pyrrhocoris TaxID=157538 RepID=A0A0N0DTZ0_LEPPY|nr:hypothetical protein ABB37_06337 [Leptomonas pyrrhocoris]KPA78164.1 hypothetical protein ABB37_06337 [Leptomonas pyrrhocoris]|eukprot:XP_015656603.1 hypothetical protein ABB37_06337 [Leptomonas pyrrhocoris]